ncbi:MAG: hypothetical protein QY323_04710 [Patescibacteria group bacterium]|nr:MAG: hypothetical protein QY323_04710 [Patescibacteria group bacterium]
MRPYIGMTDVPSAEWLRERLETFAAAGGHMLPHQLHAGIMCSYKTLHGLPTKWAAAWPKLEDADAIFIDDERVLNTLHYADYPDDEHPIARTTVRDMRELIRRCSCPIDAIQFDMVWPRIELLDAIKETSGAPRVILQVGKKALEEIGRDIPALMRRIQSYNGCVDDVLLDMSGGTGTAMGASFLTPFIVALRKEHPHLGVSVAGGLGPDTLHLVAPLVSAFPGISIDAQGQLRTSGKSLDPIEAERADAYLRGAIEMFLATVPDGAPV